jgi:hypothetical protein
MDGTKETEGWEPAGCGIGLEKSSVYLLGFCSDNAVEMNCVRHERLLMIFRF